MTTRIKICVSHRYFVVTRPLLSGSAFNGQRRRTASQRNVQSDPSLNLYRPSSHSFPPLFPSLQCSKQLLLQRNLLSQFHLLHQSQQSYHTHLRSHTMKSTTAALLALAAGSTSAQFFVLYGRDTVVSRIDPIVSPGGIGMHVHEFMGASNINQNSDYDSLQKSSCSSVGRANGNPIIEDKSAYWHPALYVKANNGTYLRVPVRFASLLVPTTLLTTYTDQWSPDLLHQCRHWPDA